MGDQLCSFLFIVPFVACWLKLIAKRLPACMLAFVLLFFPLALDGFKLAPTATTTMPTQGSSSDYRVCSIVLAIDNLVSLHVCNHRPLSFESTNACAHQHAARLGCAHRAQRVHIGRNSMMDCNVVVTTLGCRHPSAYFSFAMAAFQGMRLVLSPPATEKGDHLLAALFFFLQTRSNL